MEQYIKNINDNICRNIEENENDRGFMSQNILAQLRNLLDHICVKIYVAQGGALDDNEFKNIQNAKSYVKKNGNLQFLIKFHEFLLISASHYTFDPDSSERLMLKYYEYLLRTKALMKQQFGLDILENLYMFPIDTDPAFKEYYKAIVAKIDSLILANAQTEERRLCIDKVKPLFVNGKVYYEVTFSPSNDKAGKFDRIIAFTHLELPTYYSVFLRLTTVDITVDGMVMPVNLIVDSRVAVRLCELRNFSKIFGAPVNVSQNKEYSNLMTYLQTTRLSLTEIMDFPDEEFDGFIDNIGSKAKTTQISHLLSKCRNHIKNNIDGKNILRYLLLRLNNRIIKKQIYATPRYILGDLCLNQQCKPFDNLPYAFSLVEHNPGFSDLVAAIPPEEHKPELLARRIKHAAEQEGHLYAHHSELEAFGTPDKLLQLKDEFNKSLHTTHQSCQIEEYKGHYFIRQYEDDVRRIIEEFNKLATSRVVNYTKSVDSWMASPAADPRAASKATELKSLFSNSTIAMIYGVAGTGKSTFINFLSLIFGNNRKLYLANTNPAVDNLRRKVTAPNAEFSTIKKFLNGNTRPIKRDIIFIDECSTVSNKDMREILEQARFSLLVLVGDMFQIEAIRFGNWFNIAHKAFSPPVKIELTDVYRTSRPDLLNVWGKVRDNADDITEFLAKGNFSHRLDKSIFIKTNTDEIILSLNYDGLYGINNINRFLQNNNPNPPVRWDVHTYKIGDPVLFNSTTRFPWLYNNLKGRIIDIDTSETQITFTLEVDTIINSIDVEGSGLVILESDSPEKSIVQFSVGRNTDNDDDTDDESCIVPFQIAYAVSIHKAQGLEYSSVKIVITREVEEQITHNIFYTAITRACNSLSIYWSPETEQKIISSMSGKSNEKDFQLLKSRHPELFAARR